MRTALAVSLALAVCTGTVHAQSTSQLSENGWFSDDTRADGFGTESAGTNLVSPTLTDAPESGSGTALHDADIQGQITFVAAPGTVPAGTHRGAARLLIGASGSGKSQISHRKDDGTGHCTGADAFGAAMTAEYSWRGDGTVSVTTSFKLGVKTSEFGSTGVSGRTGENAWDKVMIYEPGNLNGGTADGLWHTESLDFTTGKWWFFDRTAGAGTIGTPMTLSDMVGSGTLVGGGPKTVADVYALITAPGAHVTSVQFGIGSGNAGGDVYVNQLETNFYRAGSVTTFGGPALVCDQDVTNNAIFGSGNANGGFTVDRNAGVEVGLRIKQRYPAANVFNSNGDGTYTFAPGVGGGGPESPLWTMEWSVNTDYDTSTGDDIDDLTYELGMDFDAGPGTNYLVFDPISIGSVIPYTPPSAPVPFWDHSIGDNSTAMGAGTEAGDAPTYAGLIAANNLAQNSWRMDFYDEFPFDVFDPTVEGRYEFYLAAYKGGDEVARSAITAIVERPLEFDQGVTSNAIFGSGNANGSYTTDRNASVEIGLRAKVRYPTPLNVFNSNGDGSYTFSTGVGGGGPESALWTMEWSANTDWDGLGGGRVLADLTYELGMDFDPGAGTNYLVFDPITIGAVIPFTPPSPPSVYWDHSIGTNATAMGGGAEAGDGPTYAALIAANNLAQNSWRMAFFDDFPFDVFDPTVPGRYEFYLAALDGGTELARSSITVLALDGASLTLEGDPCQSDTDCNAAGEQIEVELWMRNLGTDVTGFQAFLEFDDSVLTYEGALSSYTTSPFGLHIQPAASAEVAPGELRLDGNAGFISPVPTDEDSLLATLVFTVAAECDPVSVAFDLTQLFESEVSFNGVPLVTSLLDSPSIVPDSTPPVITCPGDIMVSADAGVMGGCDSAVVTFADPIATDSCTAVSVECFPPSGTAFPAGETTTVTCVATDGCGNRSTCTFDVTVSSTNTVCLDVQLVGVTAPTSRCIHFVLDDCGVTTDVTLDFDGTGLFSGEIEVPCGSWSALCAKDEQHTKWDTTALSLSMDGTKYVADTVLLLNGGDTDNDGDVDINDVTWFLFQYGTLAAAGGCPYDGTTRDADFSNNGAVGSEDYAFLTANWLTVSSCGCIMPLVAGGGHGRTLSRVPGEWAPWTGGPQSLQAPTLTIPVTALPPRARGKLDRDGDGVVDYKDVRKLEELYGLPHDLSAKIEAATLGR